MMNKPTVDELLSESAGHPLSVRSTVSEAISDLFENVQREAAVEDTERQRRRTLLIALPAAVLAAGALTAGAIAVATFDWSTTVEVPISYTTDSGRSVSCTATVQGGAVVDADARALKDYLNSQDWTGVGQRIYDRALANPFVPGEGYPAGLTSAELDAHSWGAAMTDLIPGVLPENLTAGWAGDSVGSDCTGELH